MAKEKTFFEPIDKDQFEANLDGIRITNDHLSKSFQIQNPNQNHNQNNNNINNNSIQILNKNQNNNNNNNNRNKGIKRKMNPTMLSNIQQPPTSKVKFNNDTSLLLPFDDNNENDELQKHLKENLQQLNKINNQIKVIPSLVMAEYVNDRNLLKFIDEYKMYKRNIYELKCIEYKIKLHLSANFVPKQERLRIELNDFRVKIKSNQNYEYIQNTLNNAQNITFNNYTLKLKQKIQKKEFYINALKQHKDNFNKKVKERKHKYYYNENNIFPSVNVKNSIVNNFESELNKTYKIILELDEYYDDEFERFKNKLIIQFNKLCKKIKIDININNDINYNFYADLLKALEIKKINKLKQWNDELYLNQNQENKMNDDDDDNDEKLNLEQKDDYNKYNPMSMNLPQINYVNINNKHRRLIIIKYGNFHDKYVQKQYEKSIKNKFKMNKNYDNKKKRNNKNKYNYNKKQKNFRQKSFFQ